MYASQPGFGRRCEISKRSSDCLQDQRNEVADDESKGVGAGPKSRVFFTVYNDYASEAQIDGG
jgi:hypothetical protein